MRKSLSNRLTPLMLFIDPQCCLVCVSLAAQDLFGLKKARPAVGLFTAGHSLKVIFMSTAICNHSFKFTYMYVLIKYVL